MKIAVISAHRGDAALAVGLAIGMWLERGDAVEVISCFTRSEYAPFSDAESLHENDRMSFISATRKREDEAFAKLFRGKLTMTELNLKDAPLRLHCGPDEVFGQVAESSDKAALKVRKAIESSKAHALVVPMGLGGHIDRMTARDAAIASQALPIAFYEDLPQALSLPEETIEAEAKRWGLSPGFAAGPAEDIEATVKRKRKIAWCYDSQIDEAVTLQVAEFCVRYQGRERLWMDAAWRSAAL
jgi:LmbE family N-acetylglucosaminyl deacetylase